MTAEVICIDEVPFFTEQIIEDIQKLLDAGKMVYVSKRMISDAIEICVKVPLRKFNPYIFK